MKLKLITTILSLFIFCGVYAGDDKYSFTLDLTNVVDDKLFVELLSPSISQEEIVYYLPKMIPGTYRIEDYGIYVSEFKAFDKKGNLLESEKISTNSWKIKKANKLYKITYWVEDTFDSELEGPYIFEPSGTNIEEGENFVINSSGFFGYFENMRMMPVDFDIISPKEMYGSTGLIANGNENKLTTATLKKESDEEASDKRVDRYSVANYNDMVDSPLMYCKPDTAIIKVANTEVLISTYSPNKVITAEEVANSIREILMAQKEYLGGTLPVAKYAFIMYFTDGPIKKYIGALEHSYSSMYYLREAPLQAIQASTRNFAAHEFFHIVTPLNIHSEEIGDFDFNDPKMSKHLWLYEGITEFFAGNFQVKYGLESEEQYLARLSGKMSQADAFNDSLPFVEMSLNALDKYMDEYDNVYQKGALIGDCLDILLRDLSDGQYGVQNLIKDLSTKYGKTKSFKDEELFDEIVKMTYPEVGEFFKKYVEGPSPLPFEETFKKVGVNYVASQAYQDLDFGINQASLGFDQRGLFVSNEDALSEFGKIIGLKNGDLILEINNDPLPQFGRGFMTYWKQKQEELKEGEPYSYKVKRNGEEVVLEAVGQKVTLYHKHVLSFDENATDRQLKIRNSWLKPASKEETDM